MSDLEEELKVYHHIDDLHDAALSDCFPGVRFHGRSQMGGEFIGHLPSENSFYAESAYFYKGDRTFFHLTSIDVVLSILNERAFRMYNLDSSKDSGEYNHAGKVLGLSDNQIANAKQNFFTLSFCPVSELENKHVWNQYGGESKAAIVFSVDNDPLSWDNFHLAEMKYAALEPFKDYGKRIREIVRQYPGVTVGCDMSRLIGFHKSIEWTPEAEVRLSTYYPYTNLEAFLKYAKAGFRFESGRNRRTYYIDLPVWVDNESGLLKSFGSPELDRTRVLPVDYFNTRPVIKIQKIIVGKNVGLDMVGYDRLGETLIDTCRNRLGYDVEIDYNMFDF